MRKSHLATLAVATILLAIGAGVATAEPENDSTAPWDVEGSDVGAATNLDSRDASEASDSGNGREGGTRDSDDDEWADADPEDDEWASEDSELALSECDESFSDRCHGVLSCTFTLTGEAIALPFRILGGVLRFVF